MVDDPLTLIRTQTISSKTVGKAQGFYASAQQEEFALHVNDYELCPSPKENIMHGSTLSILGRNLGATGQHAG
jgi:hypothetical protein